MKNKKKRIFSFTTKPVRFEIVKDKIHFFTAFFFIRYFSLFYSYVSISIVLPYIFLIFCYFLI